MEILFLFIFLTLCSGSFAATNCDNEVPMRLRGPYAYASVVNIDKLELDESKKVLSVIFKDRNDSRNIMKALIKCPETDQLDFVVSFDDKFQQRVSNIFSLSSEGHPILFQIIAIPDPYDLKTDGWLTFDIDMREKYKVQTAVLNFDESLQCNVSRNTFYFFARRFHMEDTSLNLVEELHEPESGNSGRTDVSLNKQFDPPMNLNIIRFFVNETCQEQIEIELRYKERGGYNKYKKDEKYFDMNETFPTSDNLKVITFLPKNPLQVSNLEVETKCQQDEINRIELYTSPGVIELPLDLKDGQLAVQKQADQRARYLLIGDNLDAEKCALEVSIDDSCKSYALPPDGSNIVYRISSTKMVNIQLSDKCASDDSLLKDFKDQITILGEPPSVPATTTSRTIIITPPIKTTTTEKPSSTQTTTIATTTTQEQTTERETTEGTTKAETTSATTEKETTASSAKTTVSTTTVPMTTDVIGTTDATSNKTMEMKTIQFRITNMAWDDNYKNVESSEYKSLHNQLITPIEESLNEVVGDNFKIYFPFNFSPGSVVVRYDVDVPPGTVNNDLQRTLVDALNSHNFTVESFSDDATNLVLLGGVAGAVGVILIISISLIVGLLVRGCTRGRDERATDGIPANPQPPNIDPKDDYFPPTSMTASYPDVSRNYWHRSESMASTESSWQQRQTTSNNIGQPSFVTHSLLSKHRERRNSSSTNSSEHRDFRLPRPQLNPYNNGYHGDSASTDDMFIMENNYASDAQSWPLDRPFTAPRYQDTRIDGGHIHAKHPSDITSVYADISDRRPRAHRTQRQISHERNRYGYGSEPVLSYPDDVDDDALSYFGRSQEIGVFGRIARSVSRRGGMNESKIEAHPDLHREKPSYMR